MINFSSRFCLCPWVSHDKPQGRYQSRPALAPSCPPASSAHRGEQQHPKAQLAYPPSAPLTNALLQHSILVRYVHTCQGRWPPQPPVRVSGPHGRNPLLLEAPPLSVPRQFLAERNLACYRLPPLAPDLVGFAADAALCCGQSYEIFCLAD
jgi:hypothetical protein